MRRLFAALDFRKRGDSVGEYWNDGVDCDFCTVAFVANDPGDNNGGDRFSKSNTFFNVYGNVAVSRSFAGSASSLLRLILGSDFVAVSTTAS